MNWQLEKFRNLHQTITSPERARALFYGFFTRAGHASIIKGLQSIFLILELDTGDHNK